MITKIARNSRGGERGRSMLAPRCTNSEIRFQKIHELSSQLCGSSLFLGDTACSLLANAPCPVSTFNHCGSTFLRLSAHNGARRSRMNSLEICAVLWGIRVRLAPHWQWCASLSTPQSPRSYLR